MKSIFNLTSLPGFFDKPWLIVGSGPTIRKYPLIEAHNYNVLCINNTVVFTGFADIVLARDPQVINVDKLLDQKFLCNAFVTDFMNRNMIPEDMKNKTHYISYACSNEFSAGIPVFPSSSSSPTAFLILGILGVKRVFSIGLDGGIGRIAELVTSELTQNMNYSQHNDACYHWANSFGMELTKL